MTQPQSQQILIQATSGRKWSFVLVRSLSSKIQLVRDASNPSFPHLILKTIDLQSDEHVQLALKDAKIWKNACNADATNIVLLHDVAVQNHRIHYIMQYCSGGNLSTQRTERSALRLLAGCTAGLETLILNTNQLCHANLSAEHIFLDDDATPKLSGWGISRILRVTKSRREITERSDVRALCAILFEMIYGTRFDPSMTTLPKSPNVSDETKFLMDEILFRRPSSIPDLTIFRYNIAAARKLLPACTAALTPIVDTKREELLNADLNSQRGLADQEDNPIHPSQPTERTNRQSGNGANANDNHLANSVPNGDVAGPDSSINENSQNTKPNGRETSYGENNFDSSVCLMARQLTNSDLGPLDSNNMNELVNLANQSTDVPQIIFKDVLFKIPISKSAVVAFKTVVFLHHLIAEGPAKFTELVIANDRFVGWIETSWSQNGSRKKSKKMHGIPFHAEAGEISYYASLLRKRASIHQRYTKLFSTHWVAKPTGLPVIKSSRQALIRDMEELVGLCKSLLFTLVAPNDPAAETKQSAIPVLVNELSKVFTAVLWLYATAEEADKSKIIGNMVTVHSSTRAAMDLIRADEKLASKCVPSALLSLDPEPPQQFDVNLLVASLKKKKRVKQKKAATDSGSSDSSNQASSSAEKPSDNDKQRLKSKRNTKKTKTKTQEDTPTADTSSNDPEDEEEDNPQEPNIPDPVRNETVPESTRQSIEENPVEIVGLRKLSLSIRKDQAANSRPELMNGMRNSRPAYNSEHRSRAPVIEEQLKRDKNGYGISDRGTAQSPEDSSLQQHPVSKPKAKKTKQKAKSRTYSDSSDSESSSGDDESPTEIQRDRERTRDRVKGGKNSTSTAKVKSKNEVKNNRKATGKKNRTDEKSIPFDKNPPKRREKSKAQPEPDEATQGSKEALAAAAKGKKTPNINPAFEVAPFEVQFGPQIGSGGFGMVFKAKFRSETVAVKKIHQHALSNAASVEEFQSEVAVLCTLRHPNILRFVGACTKPPNLMIITEFMAKGTLFDVLHQSQMRVTWPMRKKFALDTCKGMRYLHNSKLLHRDLKSSNLMLDKDLNCKVGDFGLTRISRGAAAMQMTGQCGTFQYMAVEVLANKPYSEKADVFSFGILLWEMVARKLPYFGMQPMQVGLAVMNQGLRPTIPDKCPLPLAQLMRICWDSDPNRRPSFDQIVTILESMPE